MGEGTSVENVHFQLLYISLYLFLYCVKKTFLFVFQSLGAMSSQPPIGQQQKVGVGGQGTLGSTWSDPSVNISLDFLSAGFNPTKTPPTLNNIIQQQGMCVLHSMRKQIRILIDAHYRFNVMAKSKDLLDIQYCRKV